MEASWQQTLDAWAFMDRSDEAEEIPFAGQLGE